MESDTPARLRFGPFEADLQAKMLYENQMPILLQAKPFKFLETLLGSPGAIVSRQQLAHILWPDTFVEFDQGLNAAVRKLRAVLRDSPKSPRYIATHSHQGYRFMHPVEVIQAGDREPRED
jgi:DNA-binding winged helix-turn-helix (wHTH) protein